MDCADFLVRGRGSFVASPDGRPSAQTLCAGLRGPSPTIRRCSVSSGDVLHQCLRELTIDSLDRQIIRTEADSAYCVVRSQSIVSLRNSVHDFTVAGLSRAGGHELDCIPITRNQLQHRRRREARRELDTEEVVVRARDASYYIQIAQLRELHGLTPKPTRDWKTSLRGRMSKPVTWSMLPHVPSLCGLMSKQCQIQRRMCPGPESKPGLGDDRVAIESRGHGGHA